MRTRTSGEAARRHHTLDALRRATETAGRIAIDS